MTNDASMPPAGWYPDPAGSGGQRYWDGESWSKVTRPAPEGSAAAVPAGGGPGSAKRRYSPWPLRVLAYIIDMLVLMYPLGLVESLVIPGDQLRLIDNYMLDVLGALQRGSGQLPLPDGALIGALYWSVAVSSVVWFAYRTVSVATLGASPGQLLLGMRVTRDGDAATTRLGWGQSATRAAAAVILLALPVIGLVDLLMPLFNAKRQSIHDRIARTVVVAKRSETA